MYISARKENIGDDRGETEDIPEKLKTDIVRVADTANSYIAGIP